MSNKDIFPPRIPQRLAGLPLPTKRPFAGVTFPDEWDAEQGLPDISSIASAIGVWMMLTPPHTFSVRQIGEVFNLDDDQVRAAVKAHFWAYSYGPDDDPNQQMIELDGE